MSVYTIKGNIIDIKRKVISVGELTVQHGIILSIEIIEERAIEPSLPYICPGFIDAHVHIESSMLIPSEFARIAVVHGTVATVSDPHEIANVCGMKGVRFMIENGKQVPFKFNFGAPSCVPATFFETAGAILNPSDVKVLLIEEDIRYLSEMMNFPGAISGDDEVLEKIDAALALGKPVDGHAPGLRGELLKKYVGRGISTDHECFTIEEAREKLDCGMKIIIREGSAAKNFNELIPLIEMHADHIMFCSDDKHPDSLVLGHINSLCSRAVKKGYDLFSILQAACINPILHYDLTVGMLRVGDPADFILISDLKEFDVLATYVNGIKVSSENQSLIERHVLTDEPINHFLCREVTQQELLFEGVEGYPYPVIECLDGQLMTLKSTLLPTMRDDFFESDMTSDVLKIVVVNRYHPASIAKAFIHGFGLKHGAIASSVAHDSHNIIAVGVDDKSIMKSINLIIAQKGGISCVAGDVENVLSLNVAGLMSDGDGYEVAKKYTELDAMAKQLGCSLSAPFMSLSFMALLVIPHVKLSDKGLFDGDQFKLYPS
ncbi:MAG: adenine deaminase [Chitinophagaceae bacterium]|nr:MAG: adenine deaminase [Chitinophagaceae bacterium]